jgi:hypothetical protein
MPTDPRSGDKPAVSHKVSRHETATSVDKEVVRPCHSLVGHFSDTSYLHSARETNFTQLPLKNKSCPAPAGRQPANCNCSFGSPLMNERSAQPEPNLQLQNFSCMFCRFKSHRSNKFVDEVQAILRPQSLHNCILYKD